MKRPFGDNALRLFGIAARVLGWRPPEFWTATPAELIAALSPAEAGGPAGFSRDKLKRMMDEENA